jgi:alpha-tubulin suppressor-like RCC1 family protein
MRVSVLAFVLLMACDVGKPPPPLEGHVLCWGLGRSGQTGPAATEDHNAPTAVPGVDGVTKLFAGNVATCGRTKSGLVCWGVFPAPAPLSFVPGAEEIVFGNGHTCARAGGKVLCWGRNLVGQLGNGAAPDPHTLVPMRLGSDGSVTPVGDTTSLAPIAKAVEVTGLADATQLAAGDSHTCALRKGGTVVCWGLDDAGQLGDGRAAYGLTSDHPVEVAGLSGVTTIVAAGKQTCAGYGRGAVDCWGDGHPKPVNVVDAGATTGVALRSDGVGCAVFLTGTVRCWGKEWKLGEQVLDGAREITGGGMAHMCALLTAGRVTCWGDDQNGALGRAEDSRDAQYAEIPRIEKATQVVAGARHTCVLQ